MANKSIKDAFQRFWQHCVLSFATKEYVDNAVGSGGGSSGGGIIDVLELPTANIDEQSIYRVPQADVYILAPDGTAIPLAEAISNDLHVEATVVTQVVEAMHTTDVKISSMETATFYVYIVKHSGVAFADVGAGQMSIGMAFMQSEDFNKGWADNFDSPTTMSGVGIYCMYGESKYYAYKYGKWTQLTNKSYMEEYVDAKTQSGIAIYVEGKLNLTDGTVSGEVILDSDECYETIKDNYKDVVIVLRNARERCYRFVMREEEDNFFVYNLVVYNPLDYATDVAYFNAIVVDVENKTCTYNSRYRSLT